MTDFNLAEEYRNAGFSRRGFAREVGITEPTLRRLEIGAGVHPANAKKVADYFGIKVTDLMPLHREAA